ncbi:shootin-1 [Polypterus senegalus]|uniref:shootin-1 n=1 Tax=Polypterus senegalus TaxID=55291 RepID=UPI001964B2B4|nr:shootin-1 [Polypterus senegalus]
MDKAKRKMETLTRLTNQAVDEYENLLNEHRKTKDECAKIQHERDEAVKQLKEFERVSHKVIEEVNAIQGHLDIETTCRKSAEALASKLNRQNRSLKRLSMKCMAKLGPEVLAEINIDDGEENDDCKTCTSVSCQQQKKELHMKLLSAEEEKKNVAIELQALKDRLEDVTEQLMKEKQENIVLTAEILKQKKVLNTYNRVSLLAVEEYDEIHSKLELESDLRNKAESFAHEMLVEQKVLKRQSQLLMQSVSPGDQLMKALEDIASVTQTLERERIEHAQKVKEYEEQLRSSDLKKEITFLKRQLDILEENKKQFEVRCQKSEEQARNLSHTVEELKKELRQAVNPMPPPAPPPRHLPHRHLPHPPHFQLYPTHSALSCPLFARGHNLAAIFPRQKGIKHFLKNQ